VTNSPSSRHGALGLGLDRDPDQSALAAAVAVGGEVHWHLAEVTAALREAPRPLRPELLRVVLRGLAELCGLHQSAHETLAQPPSLFGDTPVVAEALGIWEARVHPAITAQHALYGHDDGTLHP
jgi:hypothetical protein